jgi:hypothetical protein
MRITKVIGFQQFTSNNLGGVLAVSTALLADTSGNKANAALFSIRGSTGAIRFRDDGADPSATVGMHIPVGLAPYFYQGNIASLKFIADTVAGNAEVNVTYVQAID